METAMIELGFGSLARFIGLGIVAIGLILLVVFLIMKKPLTAPVVVLAAGVAVFIGATILMNKGYEQYTEEAATYFKEQSASKREQAKTDEQGNVYFEVGPVSAVDKQGNAFSNDTLKNSKYTLINVWEPWCIHCKEEFPDLVKVYETYKDKGVNVVGIHQETEDADKVISEFDLTFPTVLLSKEEYQNFLGLFSLGSVPISVLVDSNGKAVNLKQDTSLLGSTVEGVTDPVLLQLYETPAYGKRNYEFWSSVLNELLSDQN